MPVKLSGETFLYPIIGDPITFVKSPQRLTAMFVELWFIEVCGHGARFPMSNFRLGN